MHSSYASSQVQVFVQLVCTKDKANVIQASKVSKIKISASSCTPVFFTVGRRVSIYVETLLHCGTVGFRSSLSQDKPANYPSLSTEGPWGFVPLRVKTNQPTIKSLHSGTAGFRSFQGQNRPADYPSLSTVGPWGFVLPKVKTNEPHNPSLSTVGQWGFVPSKGKTNEPHNPSLSTEEPWGFVLRKVKTIS